MTAYHLTHPEPFDPDCAQCTDPLYADCGGYGEGHPFEDDGHPERVFAWIAIAALGWLVVGLIVWRVIR